MYKSPSGRYYIGQTYRERGRRSEFKRLNQSYGGDKIDAARMKYNPDNFEYKVLFKCSSEKKIDIVDIIDEKEQFYIKLYDSFKNGYNMTDGGRGILNAEYTEDARLKISASTKKHLKEKGHPMQGKKHTPESIEKMKLNTKKKFGKDNPNYGWKPTEEQKEMYRRRNALLIGDKNSFFGKHHTEEVKQFLKERFSIPVLQIDKNTNEVIVEYASIKDASRSIGMPKAGSDISRICRNVPKSNGKLIHICGGFKWKFKEKGSSTIESITER